MGEMADAIINGDFCQICGGVLRSEGTGYPRTCQDCIDEGLAPLPDIMPTREHGKHRRKKNRKWSDG